MAPVDLNRKPEEEFEDILNRVNQPTKESAREILERDRLARIEFMKRKRGDDKGGAGKSKQKTVVIPNLNDAYVPPPDFSGEYAKARTGAVALPEGWLDCPTMGEPMHQIIPCKTPLGDVFREVIEPGRRHSPETLLRNQKQKGREIGLVIDLTNTSRYYKEKEWKGVAYVKLPCRGRNEVPEESVVNEFYFEVKRFFDSQGNKSKYVIVHCTHGFNRTGYMIVNYLMRKETLETGRSPRVYDKIKEFASSRPPGIYKPEYIDSLYKLYYERKPALQQCPSTPEWKSALDLNHDAAMAEDEEDGGLAPPPDPTLGIVPSGERMSNDDVLGAAIHEEHQIQLQQFVYKLMGIEISGPRSRKLQFPGSQPVSLDRKNLQLIRQKYYYATWKADGMRYMMLILGDGVYLIDRNFRFRRVHMRFPLKGHPPFSEAYTNSHLATLLDGEMVIDTIKDPSDPAKSTQVRRYLVYDMMALNGNPLSKAPFSERWNRVHTELVDPRTKEMCTIKLYDYAREPFKVRRKGFWRLDTIASLLTKMIPDLCHEADGLIFQAYDEVYIPRVSEGLLKWKYAHMNSVDFQLDINAHGQMILLLLDRGKLRLVEGHQVSFPEGINSVDLLRKVIECSYLGDNKWEYMRTRHDKPHPNAWGTYEKVLGSINDNITEDVLLPQIDKICNLPMYKERNHPLPQHSKQPH